MVEGWLNSEAHDLALIIDNNQRMQESLLWQLRMAMEEHRCFEDTIMLFVVHLGRMRYFEEHANMRDRFHKTDWTELASHYAAKLADIDANS